MFQFYFFPINYHTLKPCSFVYFEMWWVRSHLSLPECSLKLKRWTITPQKESHIRLSALLEHLQQCLCLCQYDSICHLSEVPLGMTSSQACDTIDLSIINSLGCSWISSRKSLGSTTSLWETGCFCEQMGKQGFEEKHIIDALLRYPSSTSLD